MHIQVYENYSFYHEDKEKKPNRKCQFSKYFNDLFKNWEKSGKQYFRYYLGPVSEQLLHLQCAVPEVGQWQVVERAKCDIEKSRFSSLQCALKSDVRSTTPNMRYRAESFTARMGMSGR